MYDVYVTIDDIRIMLKHCTRRCKQSTIYKIADFCGNWNAHKLLVYDRYYLNYSIYRSLAYEFVKLSKNSKDDFYRRLFAILIEYFSKLSKVVKEEKDVNVINSKFGNINYATFIRLYDLFFEEDSTIKESYMVVLRSVISDNGLVNSIEWV